MIRVCEKGHITGYKRCSLCGAKAYRQAANHLEFPHVTEARLKREAERKTAARGAFEIARRQQQSERDKAA
jgi:hypothetical protein